MITMLNQSEFFKFDYTTNKFTDGYRHGSKFEYALAIPGDIDNSHSDNPKDWLSYKALSTRLTALGINHYLHSSRNDNLPKNGATPRPKFHVILPLSKPLADEQKYKAFCQWFIHNFNGDPQVTDTARLLFGYGEHPNPIIKHWNQGRCVDEVLSDDDLTVVKPKQKVAVEHSLLPASETVIELCRQEVAQCDPSIEGKGGDKQTFIVACMIFHDWGLSVSEGKAILDEYNQRCVPPWNETQLQHKINCANTLTDNKKRRGWKRLDNPIEGEYHQPFGAFVLNPSRTLPSARAFRREQYSHEAGFLLRYYAGDFYYWTGSYYRLLSEGAIKSSVLKWLTKAKMLKSSDEPIQFPANNQTVSGVVEALKSICLLEEVRTGAWLGNEAAPLDTPIFVQNCVYDWRTGERHNSSPHWFNQSCLNTIIDENAPEPKRWLQFLDELWNDDQASKDLLHEFMGLTLTADTSFHKILLIVGPPRSGKGTIFRMLGAIHGEENVAATTTASLISNFGLQPLLGKPLATISDARFAGRDIQVAIERLLNISGEDAVVIDQKNRPAVTVTLPTRIIVATNEIPRLPDNGGALANRFLPLQLKHSFLGHEDRNLGDELLQELPGILRLMIEGLRRLHQQGFTHTDYQASMIREVEELGSPIRSFVRECCEQGKDKQVLSNPLWQAWQNWCEGNTQQCGTPAVFGRNLKACCPNIERKRKGEGEYYYVGIGLRRSVSSPCILRKNNGELSEC